MAVLLDLMVINNLMAIKDSMAINNSMAIKDSTVIKDSTAKRVSIAMVDKTVIMSIVAIQKLHRLAMAKLRVALL